MKDYVIVSIPPLTAELLNRKSRKVIAIEYALHAVLSALTPNFERIPGSKEIFVDFSSAPTVLQSAREIAERSEKSIPDVLTGLIAATYRQHVTKETRQGPATPSTGQVDVRGQAQTQFIDQIRTAFSELDSRFVLAEGGTGLGKTRVIATLAVELAVKHRVVITVPTVENLYHHVKEWYAVNQLESAGIGVVLGKGQYFDSDLLAELCTSQDVSINIPQEARDRVMSWVAKGAFPPPEAPSCNLKRACPGIANLIDDLLHIAPEFEPFTELVSLDQLPDACDDDSKTNSYRESIEAAVDARVVYCTHAMLASHMRIMRLNASACSALGTFDALLVDEAHLLEAAVANAATEGISFWALQHALRKGDSRKKTRTAAIAACQKVMDNSAAGPLAEGLYWKSQVVADENWQGLLSELRTLGQTLLELTAPGRGKDTDRSVVNAAQTLRRFSSTSNFPLFLRLSPVRRFPSMSIGARTVVPYFEQFFETQRKVLFTSGTLYLEDDLGVVTAEYFLRNIGLDRAPGVRCLTPVKTPWLHDCVTLHYGKQGSRMCFEPPVSNQEEYRESPELYTADLRKWHQNLAAAIQTISERAAGGTLVLGTAYDDIAAVKGLIGNKLGKRLLVASRGQSMRLQKSEFIHLAKKGKRPIWITLGGAWTGLDLSDPVITPADDTILTDLVIAKLPFNLNQSLSYLVRTTSFTRGGRKYSSKVREKEAAFWFKQGVGRLVRRPGVKDRHLWLLDGRLWSRKGRYKELRGVVSPYWQISEETDREVDSYTHRRHVNSY